MFQKYLLAIITSLILLVASGCTDEPKEQNGKQTGVVSRDREESSDSISETPKDIQEDDDTKSQMEVHFIDVGQGDSTLVEVSENGEEYTILIDAGNFYNSDVIQYLQSQKVRQVDIAIGTHPDADHIGQLDQVVKTFDVEEVWLSGNTSTSETFQDLLTAIDSKGVGYHEPRMGEKYDLGSLEVEVLYPKEITGESNGESISLKLTYKDVRFVFTGDAEQENELEMVNSGADLTAEILHLGHHGSKTSTHPTFLNKVNPEVAIYSAGEDNPYGHPDPDVLKRVQDSGAKWYGTDVNRTIIVKTDGKDYEIAITKNGNHSLTSPSKVEVPEENPTEKVPVEPKKDLVTNPSSNLGSCTDINTASLEQLQEIIHIGPERAQDLIQLRPFSSIEDLSRIDGIGPSRLNDILSEGKACVGG